MSIWFESRCRFSSWVVPVLTLVYSRWVTYGRETRSRSSFIRRRRPTGVRDWRRGTEYSVVAIIVPTSVLIWRDGKCVEVGKGWRSMRLLLLLHRDASKRCSFVGCSTGLVVGVMIDCPLR